MKVLKLKFNAIKILEVMCEETSPQTKDLVQNVFKAVDIDALHTSMAYFYKLSQDEDMVSNYLYNQGNLHIRFIETLKRK